VAKTPEAHKAQQAVQYALKTGKLTKPDRCQNLDCQKQGKVEAAHEDYSQPLLVKWLCTSCHRKWDRMQPKGGTVETPAPVIQFKDRIKELRRVPASELKANPKNWRTHPAQQSAAMQAMLKEVGIAGAALAYVQDGELVLIDGHLRQELLLDQTVPVLVLDVTEAEANLLLATFDPLSQLAEMDGQKLMSLLEETPAESAILQGLLDTLGQDAADQLLAEAATAEETDAEATPGASSGGGAGEATSEYSTFTTPLTLAQEQTVRQSLRAARTHYKVDKSGDALAAMCAEWLLQHPST
jgi:hypothetical protein